MRGELAQRNRITLRNGKRLRRLLEEKPIRGRKNRAKKTRVVRYRVSPAAAKGTYPCAAISASSNSQKSFCTPSAKDERKKRRREKKDDVQKTLGKGPAEEDVCTPEKKGKVREQLPYSHSLPTLQGQGATVDTR